MLQKVLDMKLIFEKGFEIEMLTYLLTLLKHYFLYISI
jgi:hypothetical protein